MTEHPDLLADYIATGSESAFRELVARYVDLVYSAAVRLVNGDTHLAEDVTQTVFADLARLARTFSGGVLLGGWLHRHTCFVASNLLRAERRRLARERHAAEMNALDQQPDPSAQLAPVLDEAVNELGAEDRAAILLRYFEQLDFRAVGEALGSTEEAARKRVDRALAKLHSLLKRRGVTLSAGALATALAASSVTAAPVGFAITISSAALATAAATTTATAAAAGTTSTLLTVMSMTKMKAGIITALVAAGVAVPWVMQQKTQQQLDQASAQLREQNGQIARLTEENARLAKPTPRAATVASNAPNLELLKLRGEVTRLRQDLAKELARTNGPSLLGGLKSDPVMWKSLREQQKMGMGMIYGGLAKKLNLPAEQAEQLTDLLTENVMENVDHITAVLRDGLTPAQMEPIFAGQEAALLQKVEAQLGPEGLAQYQDYTRNLASHLTAEQFKGQLSGTEAEREAKAKQLYQTLLDESQATFAREHLPPDYQTVPTLNFRNFASDAEAEKNLQLLDGIYERANAKAGSFLSPEEAAKFGEFRTAAISGNRMALSLNRKMMAPGSK